MKDDGARDGGYRCECPKGMIGDGIGAEGCFRSNTTLCVSDTCYNEGTCQVVFFIFTFYCIMNNYLFHFYIILYFIM